MKGNPKRARLKRDISGQSILKSLRTSAFGKHIIILEECSSTNDVAKAIAIANVPHGLTVIAEKQTHGRGRFERTWISPHGGIWLTVLLRPRQLFSGLEGLPLLGAYAAAMAIRLMTGLEATVRWPNDVMVNDSKVGGILVESEFIGDNLSFVAVGVGINANFRARLLRRTDRRATTIRELIGQNVDRTSLICCVLRELEGAFALITSELAHELLHAIEKIDSSIGRRISVLVNERLVVGSFAGFEDLNMVKVRTEENFTERIPTSAVRSVEYLDAAI